MRDMFSGSSPFELGAWAPTGWGFLTPAPREQREVPVKGFADTGWGQLAAIPEQPLERPFPKARVLFGNPLGQQGKPVSPGKVSITYDEAVTFLEFLDIVLAPLTPEEREAEGAREACRRELQAGSFPILSRLQERLGAFVQAGDTAGVFVMSQGEMTVLEKAVECAEAVGRGEAMRKVLTVGGGIGAAALLLLLL